MFCRFCNDKVRVLIHMTRDVTRDVNVVRQGGGPHLGDSWNPLKLAQRQLSTSNLMSNGQTYSTVIL